MQEATVHNPTTARGARKALKQLFKDNHFSFTISNPREPDNPILYASEDFFKTTGYGPEEVLGRNCRFLQVSISYLITKLCEADWLLLRLTSNRI